MILQKNNIARSLKKYVYSVQGKTGAVTLSAYDVKAEISRKNNLVSTTIPNQDDDETKGYEVLSKWMNTTNGDLFTCVYAVQGKAVWRTDDIKIEDLGSAALVNMGEEDHDVPTVGLVRSLIPEPISKEKLNIDQIDNTADKDKIVSEPQKYAIQNAIDLLFADVEQIINNIQYDDIKNLPVLFSKNYNDLNNRPNLFSGYYSDLKNPPVLFDGAYSSLSGSPTLFDGKWNSLSGKPTLFDGDYSSLKNTPTLFDGTWTSLKSKPISYPSSWNDVSNKPILFDGLWESLSNKPTIPSKSSQITEDGNLYYTAARVQSYLDSKNIRGSKFFTITTDSTGYWTIDVSSTFSNVEFVTPLAMSPSVGSTPLISDQKTATLISFTSAGVIRGHVTKANTLTTVLVSAGTLGLAFAGQSTVMVKVEGILK